MSSVRKALGLLSHFSTVRPEIGLTQMCRIAKRDKATTYRHLQALEDAGFIEQNPLTRQYRLGPALLHFAGIRETTVPRKEGAQPALLGLAEATGETSHVTVLSRATLYSLTSCESPQHGTRAIIDMTTFPLHATASGLCALAFGPETLMAEAHEKLESYTDNTPSTSEALAALVAGVRETGFAEANQSYEAEIHGFSTPVFDQTGQFAGTVSVASVASRCTPALERTIKSSLTIASQEISHSWGGTVPETLRATWAAHLFSSTALETAS